MNQLENLNLTVEDFELLVEGLESIHKLKNASDGMGELLAMALVPEHKREEYEAEKNRREGQKKNSEKIKHERTQILVGKVLSLKHILIQQGIIKSFQNIINTDNK